MENKTELFKGIDKSCNYAVIYTQVVVRSSYFEICQRYESDAIVWKYSSEKMHYTNANFFQTLDEAEKDASILKSINNKKYINVHIVKR
jgi:hypothetical protein